MAYQSDEHAPEWGQEATGGSLSASQPGNEAQDVQDATRAPEGRLAASGSVWQRQPYPGNCETCRAYWETAQDLGEEWHTAARADRPPISDQLIRSLAMYGEHVATHLGPTTPARPAGETQAEGAVAVRLLTAVFAGWLAWAVLASLPVRVDLTVPPPATVSAGRAP